MALKKVSVVQKVKNRTFKRFEKFAKKSGDPHLKLSPTAKRGSLARTIAASVNRSYR